VLCEMCGLGSGGGSGVRTSEQSWHGGWLGGTSGLGSERLRLACSTVSLAFPVRHTVPHCSCKQPPATHTHTDNHSLTPSLTHQLHHPLQGAQHQPVCVGDEPNGAHLQAASVKASQC
jgi:hypothetical protein